MSDIIIKCKAIEFVPQTDANAPESAMYMDSNSNLKTKGTGETPPTNTIGQQATVNYTFVRTGLNGDSSTIARGTPISKMTNGAIIKAQSDGANRQRFCGISMEDILPGQFGSYITPGPCITNAILGLGFAPGDEVFVHQVLGEYTNNPMNFTGNNDSIIRVGIADCSSGEASAQAKDLIVFSDVVMRPFL